MPELCRFYGIVIRMFPDDHNPPHFHAVYGEHEAVVDIRTFSVFGGRLPSRALGLVVEWAALHAGELMDNWNRGQQGEALVHIAPL